jgi:DNA-binding ferritin-like protein
MVYDLSEREEEYGLSNFLAERIDAHKKHSWMLRATLK